MKVVAAPVLVGIPTNVTVTGDDATVGLSWDLVNGAQGYRVDWLSDPEPLANVAPVIHGTLTNTLRYLYTVTFGSEDIVVSAVPTSADSSAPSSVSITPGPMDNTLSWSPVSGATAYRVYWSYTPNVTAATGTRIDVDAGQTSYAHANLDPGVHYYYVVAAQGSNTLGVASAEVGARPGATLAVTATVSDGQVELNWLGGSATSLQASTSRTFDVVFSPRFPQEIEGLQNGTRYAFRVRPVFEQGPGPASTTVYATPRAITAGVPEQVILTSGRGVNTLSWKLVPNATSYLVRWTAFGITGVTAGEESIDEPPFRHSGLVMCLEINPTCPRYRYEVRVSTADPIGPVVEAVSVDLRPVPPLITNADSVILTGAKPSGTRIDIKLGPVVVAVVPFDRETGWTLTLPIGSVNGMFVFSLFAIDDTEFFSVETTYQVTRDRRQLLPPEVTIDECDPATASPRTITLSGEKGAGTAVFRAMEPGAPDQQIAGATAGTAWFGVLAVDNQTATFNMVVKDTAGNVSAPVEVALAGCP